MHGDSSADLTRREKRNQNDVRAGGRGRGRSYHYVIASNDTGWCIKVKSLQIPQI